MPRRRQQVRRNRLLLVEPRRSLRVLRGNPLQSAPPHQKPGKKRLHRQQRSRQQNRLRSHRRRPDRPDRQVSLRRALQLLLANHRCRPAGLQARRSSQRRQVARALQLPRREVTARQRRLRQAMVYRRLRKNRLLEKSPPHAAGLRRSSQPPRGRHLKMPLQMLLQLIRVQHRHPSLPLHLRRQPGMRHQ